MMVASIELCRELYELSGWDDPHFAYEDFETLMTDWVDTDDVVPAYDLGYLLRKLPWNVVLENTIDGSHWEIQYCNGENTGYGSDGVMLTSTTPEDAAAKLAIELFKAGVLKRES